MASYTFVAVLVLLGVAAHTVNAVDTECPEICPSIFNPVCGTDGKVYRNFSSSCVMKASNCRSKQSDDESADFEQTDFAWCTSELVDNLWTKFGSLDLEKNNCLRPCPMIFQPICATNGKYRGLLSNECIIGTLNCALQGSGYAEPFRKLQDETC